MSCSSDVKQKASPVTLYLQGLALDLSSALWSSGRDLNLCCGGASDVWLCAPAVLGLSVMGSIYYSRGGAPVMSLVF